MIPSFGNCPLCGAPLEQIALSPPTVSCPTGHYKVCFTTDSATAGMLTIPASASEVSVPKAFQDAFADREGLEP